MSRLLIISHDLVGPRMAGPGIRYVQLARVLAADTATTLAAPQRTEQPGEQPLFADEHFSFVTYDPADWSTLLPHLLASGNRVRRRERGDLLRAVMFGGIGVAVCGALYWGAYWVTLQLSAYEEFGDYLLRLGLSWLFLSFLAFLAFSGVVTALSTFFLSDDLRLLMASPVAAQRLFLARFTRTLGSASWMVVIFMAPVLAGVGVASCAPFGYYATTVATVVPFAVIPVVRCYPRRSPSSHWTVIVPVMPTCNVHSYSNVPAVGNVRWKLWPGLRFWLAHRLDSPVVLCATLPSFTQRTVVPGLTDRVAGENRLSRISMVTVSSSSGPLLSLPQAATAVASRRERTVVPRAVFMGCSFGFLGDALC